MNYKLITVLFVAATTFGFSAISSAKVGIPNSCDRALWYCLDAGVPESVCKMRWRDCKAEG